MIQKIPTGETHRISSLEAKELFFDFIKMYALDALDYTGNYIKAYSASENLEKVKTIRMDGDMSLRSMRFTASGTLYLPEIFFKRKLNCMEDVEEMLEEYPVLKELLCAYGIFIAAGHTYQVSRENIEIQQLLSHYIARKYFHPEFVEREYAGKLVCSSGGIYTLEHNLLQEIEMILGSEAIATVLKYGIYSFSTRAATIISKNTAENIRAGERLLEGILKLASLTAQVEAAEERCAVDTSIRNKLIAPVYRMTQNMHVYAQHDIIKRLADNDFCGKKLKTYRRIDFRTLEPLTYLESCTIKKNILDFKRRFYELSDYLFTDFPSVTPQREFMGAKGYDVSNFTDFNRIMTMQNLNRHEKDKLDEQAIALWEALQKLLIETYLPAAKDPYSRVNIPEMAFEDLKTLSSYSDLNDAKRTKKCKTMRLIEATSTQSK